MRLPPPGRRRTHPGTDEPLHSRHEQACDEGNVNDPPPLSLANGIDFGVLSRLPGYRAPSEVECMAMSDIRLYHVTVKVCARTCYPLPPSRPLPRMHGQGACQAIGAVARRR